MSLNQAFQLAAAYRQQAIDQNEQAAMQGPLLAVQALSAGLQAQAQSQQAQFQMQSMVLDTQLRIEETKTKQAMQLMNFDLAQKKLAASEQQAKQAYQLDVLRTAAAVTANNLQAQVEAFKLKGMQDSQAADAALTGIMAQGGYSIDDILVGKGADQIAEFSKANPAAGTILNKSIAAQKSAQIAALSEQAFTLSTRSAEILGNSRLAPAERKAALSELAPIQQEIENRRAALMGVPPKDKSYRGVLDVLGMPQASRITPAEGKTLIEMMGEPPLEPLRGKGESDEAFKSRMDAYRSDPYFQQVDAVRKAAFASAGIGLASSSEPAAAEPAAVAGIKEGATAAELEKERELLAAAKAQSPQSRERQLAAQAVADAKAAQAKAKAAEIDDFRGSVATPLQTSIDAIFKNPARSTYDQAVATELDTLLAAVTKAFETGKPVRRKWTPAEADRLGRINPLARPFVRPPIASEVEELRQAKTLADALSILRRLDRI